jgi:hypothetical protein
MKTMARDYLLQRTGLSVHKARDYYKTWDNFSKLTHTHTHVGSDVTEQKAISITRRVTYSSTVYGTNLSIKKIGKSK